MEFRWKIMFMLEKSKTSRPNMAEKELKAITFLRLHHAKASALWCCMNPNRSTN
jgi:hypothetical protein